MGLHIVCASNSGLRCKTRAVPKNMDWKIKRCTLENKEKTTHLSILPRSTSPFSMALKATHSSIWVTKGQISCYERNRISNPHSTNALAREINGKRQTFDFSATQHATGCFSISPELQKWPCCKMVSGYIYWGRIKYIFHLLIVSHKGTISLIKKEWIWNNMSDEIMS